MGAAAGGRENQTPCERGVENMNCERCQLEYLRRVRRVQGMAAVVEHLAFLSRRYDMRQTTEAIEAARRAK